VNLLVTSSRMPFALDEIRKFGRLGHHVIAVDTFRAAPGSHSRWASARLRVASPQHEPLRFVGDVKQIIHTRQVELVVPCFEEVFILARHLTELAEVTQVLTSPLDVLARLHHKYAFNLLARLLRVDAPETVLVEDRADLAAALRMWPRWLARPAWSRGGLDVCANAGPLAGALSPDDCHPTREQPWIVQQYVDGSDVCSFSVVQKGRVVAHCTYVHPMEIEHGGGIVFQSVEEPRTLAMVQKIVEETGYHGQLGADFRRGTDGSLKVIECNPRPTAGVHLIDDETLVDAVLGRPHHRPRVVPAGVRRQYASAVLRELVLHPGGRRFALALLSARNAPDVYGEPGDRLPSVFNAISYLYTLAYRTRHRRHGRAGTSLMAAYFDGIEWNGDPLP